MGIDSTVVPRYPEVRLERTPEGQLICDNVPVDIAPDEDIVRRGIEACAARVREILGEDGVARVRAVTEAGEVHFLAVHANGEAIDMVDPDATTTSSSKGATRASGMSRRSMLQATALAGAVAIFGGGGAGLWWLHKSRSPVPKPQGPVLPPGHDTLLPIVAPGGFSPTALWSLPVARSAKPFYVKTPHTSGVLITRPNATTTLYHPTTGASLWSIAGYKGGATTVMELAGRHFLVEKSTSGLQTWRIPSPGDAGAASPSPEALLADAGSVTMLSTGPMPLFVLPTQTVQVFNRSGKLIALDVPAGYTPIGATTTHVVSVNLDTKSLLAQAINDSEADPVQLVVPDVSTGYTLEAAYLIATRLVTAWKPSAQSASPSPTPAQRPMVALYDVQVPASVAPVAQQEVTQLPGVTVQPLTSPQTAVAVLGNLMVTAAGGLYALEGTVKAVADAGVYHEVDSQLIFTEATGNRVETGTSRTTAPDLQWESTAYFVAEKLDTYRVYATSGTPRAASQTTVPATGNLS